MNIDNFFCEDKFWRWLVQQVLKQFRNMLFEMVWLNRVELFEPLDLKEPEQSYLKWSDLTIRPETARLIGIEVFRIIRPQTARTIGPEMNWTEPSDFNNLKHWNWSKLSHRIWNDQTHWTWSNLNHCTWNCWNHWIWSSLSHWIWNDQTTWTWNSLNHWIWNDQTHWTWSNRNHWIWNYWNHWTWRNLNHQIICTIRHEAVWTNRTWSCQNHQTWSS